MIAAVVTDKNERLRLPPRVAAIVEQLLVVEEDIEGVYAGELRVDIGPGELHTRFTKVLPRVKVAR